MGSHRTDRTPERPRLLKDPGPRQCCGPAGLDKTKTRRSMRNRFTHTAWFGMLPKSTKSDESDDVIGGAKVDHLNGLTA